MQSTKLCVTLLISVVFIGVLFLNPAFTLINSSITIRNNGAIVTNKAYPKSGSVETIQAAVDAVVADGGGTVYIPEGTFNFNASGAYRVNITVPANGISIFGAGIDDTVLAMPIDDNAPNTDMFVIDGSSGGKVRISGITFKGRPNIETSPTGDSGVMIKQCQDFRVDHCAFYDMGGGGVYINDALGMYGHAGGDYNLVSQGVVDHCEFYDIYKPACRAACRGYGYGVVVNRASHYLWGYNIYPNNPWNTQDGFGKYYKNTYIEDCYFYHCRHAVCGNWVGAYVLRYSTIEDIAVHDASTTGHPVRTDTFGQLYCEIYDVTIRRVTSSTTFIGPLVEGGYALIYNNHFENLVNWMDIGSCEDADGTPYHPLGCTSEVYVWGNEIVNCGALVTHSNTGLGGCTAPVENVDYFLHAPNASVNYVPYTYPHPLTLESP